MLLRFRKNYVFFLVFFIVILLHSPAYHQHFNNHYPGALKHADHIAPHSPNDYSVNSHIREYHHEVLPIESHHTYYHLHLKEGFFRSARIDMNKIKTVSVYKLKDFNNLSTHSNTLKKYSYDYYKPRYYSNNYTYKSSGLSPPIYST